MKTRIMFLLLVAPWLLVQADESNYFYVTDDASQIFPPEIKSAILEAAKTNRESLPAALFTEGNWGPVGGGFQLSLRFEKQTFTNGEPINAILLMRNVTNASMWLTFDLLPVGYMDGPVGFRVFNNTGSPLSQHKYEANVWNGRVRGLAPGTQAKFEERLDQRFDFTNGIYTVQAVKRAMYVPNPKIEPGKPVLPGPDLKQVDVQSADVSITIGGSQ
jgi:hypothetical protein